MNNQDQNFDDGIETLDIEPQTAKINNGVDDYSNNIGSSIGISPSYISNIDLSKKEQIGFLPPEKEEKKKKKNIVKLFVTIIIVCFSIALVGFGVYYYLSLANSKAKKKVILKDLVFDVDTSLSTSPLDYATFNGISSTNCYVNTKDVDTKKSGKSNYSIVCGNEKYDGTITILDKTPPEAVLKTVNKKVNDSIEASEFIESCTDDSECIYSFMDEQQVKASIQNVGSYTVRIKVSDTSGNSIYLDGTLNVTSSDIAYYLECSSPLNNSSEEYVSSIIDELGFNDKDEYLNTLNRTTSYMYLDSNAYKTDKENSGDNAFKNQTGIVSFDDSKYTVKVTYAISKEQFESESNQSDLNNYETINNYYNSKSYICIKK